MQNNKNKCIDKEQIKITWRRAEAQGKDSKFSLVNWLMQSKELSLMKCQENS